MAYLKVDTDRLHYVDHGSGRPVVLLHGNLASTRWWLPTLERLPHGVRVVAYDLRGYGWSDKPGRGYTLPRHVADLRAVIAAIDVQPVHLVGHSLGATVALQFALEYPQLVERLTLLDCAPLTGFHTPGAIYHAVPMLLANRGLFEAALRRSAPMGPFDDSWERLVDDGLAADQRAWIESGHFLEHWNVQRSVAAVKLPVLVVHGTADALVSTDVAKQTAHAIPGAKLALINNVGHSPNVERPVEWMRVLVPWLGLAR